MLAGGKNVFPEEVEAAYGQSALIQELAVLERGGRLVGLIVPTTQALRTGAEELQRQLRAEIEQRSQQLASYQRLSDLAITPETLPRTQIGKLRRHLLDEVFERAKAGAAAPARAGGALGARSGAARLGRAGRGLALARGALRAQALDPRHQPAARPRPRLLRLDDPHDGARRAVRRPAQRGGARARDVAARPAGRDRAGRAGDRRRRGRDRRADARAAALVRAAGAGACGCSRRSCSGSTAR